MPFANIKVPQAALSKTQKEEIVHRVTNMFVEYFSEAARPHTMVLIQEVPERSEGLLCAHPRRSTEPRGCTEADMQARATGDGDWWLNEPASREGSWVSMSE